LQNGRFRLGVRWRRCPGLRRELCPRRDQEPRLRRL